MKPTNRQKIKRLAINLAALLVITIVALLAIAPTQFWGQNDLPDDLPPLKGQINDVDIDLKLGEINVALVVKETDTQDDIAADMVAIYKWGRGHLPPYACGPGNPPNLCVKMWVRITLVVSNNTGDLYPMTTIGLDQVGLEKLAREDPQGMEKLSAFFEKVSQESNNSNISYEEYPAPPPPFEGFK